MSALFPSSECARAATLASDRDVRLNADHASSVQAEQRNSSFFVLATEHPRGPAPTRAHLPRAAACDAPAIAWSGFAAPTPSQLIDRVNPAGVALAMLAGFGLAMGVGSILFGGTP